MNSCQRAAFGAAILAAALAAGGCDKKSDGNTGAGTETSPFIATAVALRTEGLRSERAVTMLAELVQTVGPRLPGSPAAAAAVEHMRRVMDGLGFETWLEPTTVQHWVRGEETAEMVDAAGRVVGSLTVSSLGGSVPTPESGVLAPLIEVDSFDRLDALDSSAPSDDAGPVSAIDAPMTMGSAAKVVSGRAASASRATGGPATAP